ncbi:MAG TPA: glycosyltransferase family 2 protein [Candidatus Saccharimonadales bacterium]
MYKNKRITVCFPCRNEANHLKEVIAKVPDFVDEIIIISNKSTDDTVKVAKKLGLKAYEDNRDIGGIGYGFAHMTGIKNATGDIIVGADGDATYPIEDLAKIIDRLLDDELDFISCNRYPLQDGTKIPFKLKLGVGMLNLEVRVLYGVKIKDILSGMWVFRSEIRDQLDLTMGDWNLSPEIKINAATNSEIAFAEHSIAQHQRLGETHQNYFKTGFSHAMWILKNRFTRGFLRSGREADRREPGDAE